MANIKLGALVADVRGSVGGTCFSRGSGGAIVRNAPKPCNPRTPLQSARRATIAYLTQAWSTTLTQPIRDGWDAYAAATNWTNKVGTGAIISGLAAFVRYFSLYLQIGGDLGLGPPTANGHAGTPTFTFTANPTAQAISIAKPSEPWVNNVAANFMAFFQHSPTGQGRLSIPTAKQYLGMASAIPGGGAVWPKAFTGVWPYSAGQIVRITGIYLDGDHRVGGDYTAQVVAAVP